jgi:hypothetical protein
MNRFELSLVMFGMMASSAALFGCQPGGVGDPCIPEDEYYLEFSGYGVEEVNIESKSFQCETRLCLVNHFQGRVSCPYGQSDTTGDGYVNWDPVNRVEVMDANPCHTPDVDHKPIRATVEPQLIERRANDTVYCSCRCAGPDKKSKYCECPSGFSCELLNDVPLGASQLEGSYCVKNGTQFQNGNQVVRTACAPSLPANQCPSEGVDDPAKNP